MADFDTSILGEFVVESKEHLTAIERELLDLEKNSENVDPEKINEIFRGIHSIKGAAGFLGFYKIGCLSHVMETILSLIRSNEITPEAILIGKLLNGVDCLNTMFDDIDSSNEINIDVLHSELGTFANQNTESTFEDSSYQEAPCDTSDEPDFIIDEFYLNKIPKSNEYLFSLEYNLIELFNNKIDLVELISELEGLGTIIETKVKKENVDLKTGDLLSPMTTKVLFSTVLDLEMIREGTCLDISKIKQIEYNQKEPVVDQVDITDPKKKELIPAKTNAAKLVKKTHEVEAIRINVDVLDRLMTLAGELVLVRNQCMQAVGRGGVQEEMENVSQHLDMITTELQEAVMLTRMQPVGNVFSKLPRIVRDLSIKLEKEIEIKTIGNDVEIDKTILQALADPLTHLVRNCCDHAIESSKDRVAANKPSKGLIAIHAYHEAGQINIEVKDDGKGLDIEAIKKKAILNELKTASDLEAMNEKEILSLIMLPGFSTAKIVSDVSGRGVGMDVVRSSIERLGGEVELISAIGTGTTIHMRLPLTLAIIPSLVIGVNGQRYAIPQVSLEELVSLDHEDDDRKIESTDSQEVFRLRDHLLPIVRFNEVLQNPDKFTLELHTDLVKKYHTKSKEDNDRKSTIFAVVKVRGQRYGLVVDEVFGTEEIVVKPMHVEMKKYEIYSGATVMGDGKVALILSTEGIAKHANVKFNLLQEDMDVSNTTNTDPTQSILLFKSGANEQFAVPMPLIRRVERIQSKNIELVGDHEFISIDDDSTFILRLDRVLKVSKCLEEEELYLLLPKEPSRPFGILMSRVVDIVEIKHDLKKDSYLKNGVLGTSIINKHMTLFLDIFKLLEEADPDWSLEFSDKNKKLIRMNE